ncbi:hypothetical protein PVAND_010575 [Polypedilum vanderplanki]|uniref:Claspin-like protein n=1 Tax=Polypedilum vanderplanki TaxID=319348 RepID=A0A9J6CH68_POLVA|nr:hypothetical protein PVAND_010575 [Polypedilum vanderplanki]
MELNEEENKVNDIKTVISDSPDEVKKEEIQIPRLKTLNEMNGNAMVIDIFSGSIQPKKLSGPELLYQKFLKTQAKPKINKEKVCMNILSFENGKLGIQKVEVKLEKEAELDHNRPGFSREKLKQNLRDQIVQKRLETIKSKGLKSEFEPEEKCKSNENKENQRNSDESDGDYDPQEHEEQSEESDDDEEEEEESSKISKNKKKDKCAFIDNEAIDEDDENLEEEQESSEESSDEEEQNAQKKGRILKAFVDSDDEQQNSENKTDTHNTSTVIMTENDLKESAYINSQATDFTFDEPSISEEILPSRLGELIDTTPNVVEDEDLMDICSGQFLTTQAFEKQNEISQNNLSEPIDNLSQKEPLNVINESECLTSKIENDEQFSKKPQEEEEEETSTKNVKKLLESTDDEADNECEDSTGKRKVKKKKSKQKMKKLGFSDDESDEEIIQNAQTFDNESELECEEEEEEEAQQDINNDEILIDYDSEENEIEVKMTKKEKLKKAQEYFENEAELSESEWGSADEDEKGLDKYEIELADDEQFDETKLREEVGRIHARKVMDEDLKNVKKIQELLFEDEENDGVGRDRKFRWKNQSEGFTLDDENARDGDDDQNELDEENEAQWRKMRYERETLINEQSQKMLESETMSEDILILDQNSQTVTSSNTSLLVKKKFQIIRTSSCSLGLEPTKKESPFLIKTDQRKFSNSFLSKGEHTLAKIASFMTNKNINDDEVTNLSSHGGNSMSFAPIDKNIDSKKRKSDENDKDSIQKVNVKKRKINNHQFLLDQLS